MKNVMLIVMLTMLVSACGHGKDGHNGSNGADGKDAVSPVEPQNNVPVNPIIDTPEEPASPASPEASTGELKGCGYKYSFVAGVNAHDSVLTLTHGKTSEVMTAGNKELLNKAGKIMCVINWNEVTNTLSVNTLNGNKSEEIIL